jgi:TRAP transporter TAXI family solute receptor
MRALYIFFIFCSFLNAIEYKFASGALEGRYYKLALKIKKIVEDNTSYKIKIIKTNGSIDNLKGLKNKQFDIALIQSDILFTHLNRIDNSTLPPYLPIASFYKEPIYIVTNKNNILNIDDLAYRNINVGPIGSGLRKSASDILKATRIYDKVSLLNFSIKGSVKALLENKIDAIALNTLPDSINKKLKERKLFLVSVSDDIIKKLHNTFPFYEKIYCKVDKFKIVPTIATKALLVARTDLNNDSLYNLLNVLHINRDKLSIYLNSKKELFRDDSVSQWHKAVYKFVQNDKRSPLLNKQKENQIIYFVGFVVFAILFMILIAILIIYYSSFFHHFKSSHTFVKYTYRIYQATLNNKYKTILISIIIFYIMSAFLIKYYEHKWAIGHSTYSIFDSYSLWDTITWLFIFANSGYNGDIFPISQEAKVMVSLIPFVSVGGIIVVISLYMFDKIKLYLDEINGMGGKKVKNHIIICGWNNTTKDIINSLTHENILKKNQIVVMLPNDESINEFKKYNFDQLYVSYIQGNATNKEDLDRANIKEAKTAIILSDKDDHDDSKAILSVLKIEKYSKELIAKNERKDDIYTIIEIQNEQNAQLAYDADADQVVTIGGIESKIFTQCILNPGVIKFMHEIMTLNDQNDIYSIEVDSKSPFIGKVYDEILTLLRKYNILLLAINVGYKRSRDYEEEIVKKYNLDDSLITNPFKESEKKYMVHEGDLLIVLAQYGDSIKQALEKINKLI